MADFQRASLNDAEELIQMKIKAFAEDVETYGFGPPDYDSIEDLKKSICENIYYKILYGDKIIGGFCLLNVNSEYHVFGSIYLAPEYHNQGIGTKVFDFIEGTYPQVKKWTLETPYLSYRNHHFYEKAGYVKVGETEPDAESGFYLFLYEKHCD